MSRGPIDADHFAYRVIREAWLDATAAHWIRRAEQLEAARPRTTDWVPPHVTAADRQARWDRLTAAAQACRARAGLAWATTRELDETLTSVAIGAAA